MFPLFNDSLPIAALFPVLHPTIYRAFSLPVGLSLASVVAHVDSSTSPMTNMQRRTQTSTALNVLRREIITVFCHRVSRNHEDDQSSSRPTHRDPFSGILCRRRSWTHLGFWKSVSRTRPAIARFFRLCSCGVEVLKNPKSQEVGNEYFARVGASVVRTCSSSSS